MYAAELDHVLISAAAVTINEDSFNFLEQTGRKIFWEQGYHGQGVVVAVLDTGVNTRHPELVGQVFPGKNFAVWFSGEDTNDTSDNMGHGTHVAATIAGKLKCGVAPAAKILPVKVLDDDGALWFTDWLFDGLRYALEWRGPNGEKVDIVNMSINGRGWKAKEVDTLRDLIRQLNAQGIMVIVAAGNSGKEETVTYPASLDEVITVGAVDVSKQTAYFTSTGDMVDLCQIGVNVLSADTFSDGYVLMSGTSMATPAVTGIAALVVCKDKILNGKYNPTMPGTSLELAYYKELRNKSLDLGVVGTDKIFGTGFCTLNQKKPTELLFTQGSNVLKVNGKTITMDAPVTVVNGRTMVPIRYFAENAGGIVSYNKTDKSATIVI